MKRPYLYLLSPIAISLIVSCGKGKQQNAAQPPTAVNVAEVKKADAVYYDQYQGTVVALNSVELRSQVAGFITAIFFKEGEVVPKGKELYEIDRRKFIAAYNQAQANLSSAQANLVKAQKDVDRYTYLEKNDAVAKQTVDQAVAAFETNKSAVESAKAQLSSAKTDLSYSIIAAPFSGRIGISQVKLGAQITPGSTLLNTISSENPIAVDFVVNEQDIDRFYKFQKKSTDSTFRLQLSDGTTVYNKSGKIIAIDRGVNNQTGTTKVRVQFPNDKDVLKDGMSCVMKVLNEQSGEQMIIPNKAVTEQMGEYFVFVSLDTIAVQRKVAVGQKIGSDIIVLKGLKPGDKVITDGFQRLRDSSKITLGNPAAQQPAQQKQGGK
jgi:RND family efflux transporter MFP subunit